MASLNYGLADVGMIGLRDVLVVAPPASFHSPHHHHAPNDDAATLLSPAEHPFIPLLAAAPCLVDDFDSAAAAGRGRVHTGVNLWQNQHAHLPPVRALESHNPIVSSSSYFGKPTPVPVFDATSAAATAAGVLGGSFGGNGGSVGGLMGGAGTGGVGPSSSATCQDCGNQAKKDCSHRRCRTCCKSRGFDCASHVKSTWVPAARRRERQASAAAILPVGRGAAAASSASTSAAKKPRLLASDGQAVAAATASRTSTSNTTPRSVDTGSSHQDASFRESLPGLVRTPAVFRCVRVTTVDEGEDEFAYQAMVNIGGHIFKGFLYDQGIAEEAAGCGTGGGNRDRSNNGGMPNISELHLGGAAAGGGPPTDVYDIAGRGGGGLMGSKAYGNPIN